MRRPRTLTEAQRKAVERLVYLLDESIELLDVDEEVDKIALLGLASEFATMLSIVWNEQDFVRLMRAVKRGNAEFLRDLLGGFGGGSKGPLS